MRKKICMILALAFILSFALQTVVLADDIMLLNNNTNITLTNFSISDSGKATVDVCYSGYPNITTGATITVKIEKRTLLVFWNEVVSDTITVTGDYYNDSLYYQLEKSGTYRCTVVYTVSGSGGADDIIPFEDTASY